MIKPGQIAGKEHVIGAVGLVRSKGVDAWRTSKGVVRWFWDAQRQELLNRWERLALLS